MSSPDTKSSGAPSSGRKTRAPRSPFSVARLPMICGPTTGARHAPRVICCQPFRHASDRHATGRWACLGKGGAHKQSHSTAAQARLRMRRAVPADSDADPKQKRAERMQARPRRLHDVGRTGRARKALPMVRGRGPRAAGGGGRRLQEAAFAQAHHRQRVPARVPLLEVLRDALLPAMPPQRREVNDQNRT